MSQLALLGALSEGLSMRQPDKWTPSNTQRDPLTGMVETSNKQPSGVLVMLRTSIEKFPVGPEQGQVRSHDGRSAVWGFTFSTDAATLVAALAPLPPLQQRLRVLWLLPPNNWGHRILQALLGGYASLSGLSACDTRRREAHALKPRSTRCCDRRDTTLAHDD